MKLYHLTQSSNSESIAVRGLIPAKSKGLSGSWKFTEEKWRNNVVWLTDDPEYILDQQAGYCWAKSCVMYEVDCSSLNIEHRKGFYDDHEWLYYGTIPPTLLEKRDYSKNI